jgi:hypothetical protein
LLPFALCRDSPIIEPCDVVQIRRDADEVMGGMLLRVCRTTKPSVEGYLLAPHRCGGREAWYKYSPSQIVKIGRVRFKEAEWGFGRGWPWQGLYKTPDTTPTFAPSVPDPDEVDRGDPPRKLAQRARLRKKTLERALNTPEAKTPG